MSKSDQSDSLVPHSILCIDARWRHFFTTMISCLCLSSDQKTDEDMRWRLSEEIGSLFGTRSGGSIVSLSVRTGFDLFFRAKRFPTGSEVIMSAINIPGMIEIVRAHGLVPVPWDIDAGTLSPKIAKLSSLITDRSVAIVVAHLFGKKCTVVDAAVKIAKSRGLYFVEDCAESFDVFDYSGHVESDVILFSFGTLKLFTAFGGAICKIRDPSLYDSMNTIYNSDPLQSRPQYLKKLLITFIAAVGMNVPLVMQLGVPVANFIGLDYKRRVLEMLRGFPTGDDVWLRLRQRPSLPLLMLLRERLRTASVGDITKIKAKGYFVKRLLPDGVMIPGGLADNGHEWLFPIVVEEPELVLKRLNEVGIDALIKATQLTVVSRQKDTNDGYDNEADEASELLNHIVYLPVHKNVPYKHLRRISKAVDLAVSNGPVKLSRDQMIFVKSKL